jgi:hypothetical protein
MRIYNESTPSLQTNEQQDTMRRREVRISRTRKREANEAFDIVENLAGDVL